MELLFLGTDLFATQRRPVAAGTGRCASVARCERRSTAHFLIRLHVDVRRSVLFLRRRVSVDRHHTRSGVAPGRDLFTAGVLLDMEEGACVRWCS